jgi:malate dehydrogenase (oxaloacetate-decarboxylating)(NADP+)
VLLGSEKQIKAKMEKLGLTDDLKSLQIIQPDKSELFEEYYRQYCADRQRSGISLYHAEDLMVQENFFGSMLARNNEVDSFIAGPTLSYASNLLPIINVIGTEESSRASGIYILVFKNRVLFFADCTTQIDPTAEDMAEIAANTAELFRKLLHREPRVAFLSYSNFGSTEGPNAVKMREATAMLKEQHPELIVDGEIQTDFALNKEMLQSKFPFSKLVGKKVNTLIYPNLESANGTYKLLKEMNNADSIGPIMMGMRKPVHILQLGASVDEIVNMAAVAVVDAQEKGKKEKTAK